MENHSFITSRVPVILYNDGENRSAFSLKEMAAISSRYLPDMQFGAIRPDFYPPGDGIFHGVAHMRYWFGNHVWHVGPLVPYHAGNRCQENISKGMEYWPQRLYINALTFLGRALHYLQDCGCPYHTYRGIFCWFSWDLFYFVVFVSGMHGDFEDFAQRFQTDEDKVAMGRRYERKVILLK